jgi:hypothetical protein
LRAGTVAILVIDIVNPHRPGSLPAERPGDADATGSRVSLRKEYSFANSRSQSAAETMTARLASGEVSSPPRLPVLVCARHMANRVHKLALLWLLIGPPVWASVAEVPLLAVEIDHFAIGEYQHGGA